MGGPVSVTDPAVFIAVKAACIFASTRGRDRLSVLCRGLRVLAGPSSRTAAEPRLSLRGTGMPNRHTPHTAAAPHDPARAPSEECGNHRSGRATQTSPKDLSKMDVFDFDEEQL